MPGGGGGKNQGFETAQRAFAQKFHKISEVTLASPDFRQMGPKGGRLLILSGVPGHDG
jgi:hypothetical protein